MRLALSRIEAPVRRGAWWDSVEVLRAQHARALLVTEDLEANCGPAPERAVETALTREDGGERVRPKLDEGTFNKVCSR
jgi:hypothetical protein